MRLYLTDAGRIPRLTPEEEIALAARIAVGDGDAERRMVEANLRLVVFIARQFLGRGFPLTDLIQEGNLGLMAAVPRWQPDLGKFATYAVYWIRRGIIRALDNTGSTVRLPVHFRERRGRLARIRHRLEQQHGRAVSHADVEAELPPTQTPWNPQTVHHLLTDGVSLDAPLRRDDGGDDLTVAAMLEDETVASPEDTSVARETRRHIDAAMARLTPRQARVMDLRYSLSTGGDPLTLEAVGALLGLTRERIRQIEAQSLSRLRKRLTRAALLRVSPRIGSNGHRQAAAPPAPPAPTPEVVRLRTRRGTVVRRFGASTPVFTTGASQPGRLSPRGRDEQPARPDGLGGIAVLPNM